ncbi:uncharacterized protein MYCFIDRAFT_180265 [Pseudocercospora fijiensis CIRAD86]|uniref:Uncharacterized protein n=1 Tax=Pseudocercospora fijiensis (strain CIRAD86) TaxID=383855 RepID=M3AIU8_PSEFD|nr:uncharacterized protein MYCFIDRAFT_180265 [Pseudocercospora fijiensis CIRAD86]EME77118.1 hypothetical protein MYCFIDRAFT_180265 [Pseudocercospora fijiensis CIRAD86]
MSCIGIGGESTKSRSSLLDAAPHTARRANITPTIISSVSPIIFLISPISEYSAAKSIPRMELECVNLSSSTGSRTKQGRPQQVIQDFRNLKLSHDSRSLVPLPKKATQQDPVEQEGRKGNGQIFSRLGNARYDTLACFTTFSATPRSDHRVNRKRTLNLGICLRLVMTVDDALSSITRAPGSWGTPQDIDRHITVRPKGIPQWNAPFGTRDADGMQMGVKWTHASIHLLDATYRLCPELTTSSAVFKLTKTIQNFLSGPQVGRDDPLSGINQEGINQPRESSGPLSLVPRTQELFSSIGQDVNEYRESSRPPLPVPRIRKLLSGIEDSQIINRSRASSRPLSPSRDQKKKKLRVLKEECLTSCISVRHTRWHSSLAPKVERRSTEAKKIRTQRKTPRLRLMPNSKIIARSRCSFSMFLDSTQSV